MIPNSNNKLLSRIGCLGCSLVDHQRSGSPRCNADTRHTKTHKGEQAWTLKTRSLFYSLQFIGVQRSMLPGAGGASLLLSIERERERVGVRLRTLTLLCLSMPCPPVTWMINVLPLSSKWGIEASIDSVFPLGSPQVQKKAQVRSTVCIHSLLLALHNPISVLRNLPSILLLSCLC
jgi:hypothetical protein